MPPAETSPYQLLVEGSDDKHSIIHLLLHHGFDWEGTHQPGPFVKVADTLSELVKIFPLLLKGPHARVGCVVDANAQLLNRWAQLKDRARAAGVELPDRPSAEGTIVTGRRPGMRVGVWLMPDNQAPGTLEDLLVGLVPEGNAPWAYSQAALEEALRLGAPVPEKERLKSRLHTWLAWQAEPGLPFGTALKAQFLRSDSEVATRFVSWFHRLFVA